VFLSLKVLETARITPVREMVKGLRIED